LDITLADFYRWNGVELHLFSFELNEYKVTDISYLTYPDLPVITAVQMSCCLPLLIQPVCLNGKIFIDGGVACNYPLNYCIESGKKVEEILGLKNKYGNNTENTSLDEESTLLDFLLNFLFKAIFSISANYVQPKIENELIFNGDFLNLKSFHHTLSSIDARKEHFQAGQACAAQFIQKLRTKAVFDTDVKGEAETKGDAENVDIP